ncbi:MAG: PAS domain-containing sensor histidine kinase [Pseudomonadota bacterium]
MLLKSDHAQAQLSLNGVDGERTSYTSKRVRKDDISSIHPLSLRFDDKTPLGENAVLQVQFLACRRPKNKELTEMVLSRLYPALVCRARADRAETSHSLFKDILHAAGDAILTIDQSRNILLFNEQAQRLFGYTSEEIIGKPLQTLIPHEVQAAHEARISEFMSQPDHSKSMGRRAEVFGRRKDNSLFPADVSIAKSTNGDQTLMTAVVRDLTRLRNTEYALLERESELEEIIERMPFGIAICGEDDGRVLLANDAFVEMTRMPAEEIKGLHASAFFEGLSESSLALEPLWSQATFKDMEIPIRRRGAPNAHSIVSTVRLTYQGKRTVLFGCNDISALLQALEELKKRQEKLTQAQHIARLGDWEWNLSDNQLHWSDEASRILGPQLSTTTATPADFLECVHPDDRHKVQDAFASASTTLSPISVTLRLTPSPKDQCSANSFPPHIRLEARPEQHEDGSAAKWVGTIQDITQQARIHQELVDARNTALEANQSKTRFLANMSHELRTPLNAIIGFSEFISQDLFDGDVQRYRSYAEDILRSGKHLLDLVNDVLDSSRIESGNMQLNEDCICLAEIAQNCLKMMQGRAEEKHITLSVDRAPDFPWIYADSRLCRQIFLNLLVNAVKFTQAGKKVGVDLRRDTTGRAVVEVWDNGLGIAEENLDRILRPFEQVASDPYAQHEGVGLGLSLCKRFAELHDAELILESEVGSGTSARVIFPADRSIETPETCKASCSVPACGGSGLV